MKTIKGKEDPQANQNYLKYRSPSDTRLLKEQNERLLHNKNRSDLPRIFGEMKSIKSLKSM